MSAVLVSPNPGRSAPSPLRWTVDEFHDLFDDNRFEGRWVILLDGAIIEMPKPKPPHDTGITLTDYLLKGLFHTGHYVRCQCGLPLGLDTDPIPDVAVVVGSPRDHAKQHPATAVLVVEVSDTTLAFDKGTKSHLYAAAGIAEYWVIDVTGGEVTVFRDPTPDVAAPPRIPIRHRSHARTRRHVLPPHGPGRHDSSRRFAAVTAVSSSDPPGSPFAPPVARSPLRGYSVPVRSPLPPIPTAV